MRSSDRADVVVDVATGEGIGRFVVDQASAPRAVLVLGHGAGGGVDAIDLFALARGLPAGPGGGVTVVRFEQPWRTAGGRVAVRPARLDAAWSEALSLVLDRRLVLPGVDPVGPWFVGGRSAGARVACRTASVGLAGRIAGVVCCAFPLHPPGRPNRSRIDELVGVDVPRLVLQGDRDAFGSADDVRAAVTSSTSSTSSARSQASVHTAVTVVDVPGADHAMRLTKAAPISPVELRALLVDRTLDFVDGLIGS